MKRILFIVFAAGIVIGSVYNLILAEKEVEHSKAHFGEEESVEVSMTQPLGVNVGDTAPDFELKTLEGEMVKLSDFKGEHVMLNFWATWCPPCRQEMPDMQRIYQDKDPIILAVNLTDTEVNQKAVSAFIEEFGMTFPVLMDEKAEVSELYRIQPIPTTYFIDSEGKIRYKAFGALSYEQMIQEFENMKETSK
ncbi:TlpA family protein disulfide reductase [Oceanobacillus manasiensis]|uniref:TlpA family protein disulfide reductase n=1 Tax=Oceanobacillus manasiensis TaxID=586413 RepID=UPI0005A71E73|nr:redoxin domain-containing protein [Oceanobacillus manasiensis]